MHDSVCEGEMLSDDLDPREMMRLSAEDQTEYEQFLDSECERLDRENPDWLDDFHAKWQSRPVIHQIEVVDESERESVKGMA